MAQYDLLVIGGGPGGLTAALEAGAQGARVALAEPGPLGGACLNWGCIPSKTLIQAGKVARWIDRAADVGITVYHAHTDWSAVLKRVRRVIAELQHEPGSLAQMGIDHLQGRARFVGTRRVRITGESTTDVQARSIIIATGARPITPKIPGLADSMPLHAWQLWDHDKPLGRLAVLGGGPEGVEFAQACQRLGANVTLIERQSRLLHREEPELSNELCQCLSREGVDVRLGSEVQRVEVADGSKRLFMDGSRLPLEVDTILLCIGARPALQDLGLDDAGIAYSETGITVDPHLRTSQPHIWAVGDVTGAPMLAHKAEYDGLVAARNALGHDSVRANHRLVPRVAFSDPELASVGLLEHEAAARGYQVAVGRYRFADLGKAHAIGQTAGQVKIVVDAQTRHILGVHILGADAGTLINEAALAMRYGRTVGCLTEIATIHASPTLSQALSRAAENVGSEDRGEGSAPLAA